MVAVGLLLAGVLASPAEPALVLTGVPFWREGSLARAVRLVTHSVTIGVEGERIRISTVTQFKNETDDEIRGRLAIPLFGQNWRSLGLDAPPPRPSLRWDQTLLEPVEALSPADGETPPLPGLRYAWLYEVTFRPRSTHALRLAAELPLGRGGLGRDLRMIGYDFQGFASWRRPVSRLNFAVQTPPGEVFQVHQALPRVNWQIGPRGAFFRRENLTELPAVLFSYYRNAFEPLGTDR